MSKREIKIGGRLIGSDHPAYIIAEISANHNGSLDAALEIVRLAAESGADAVKIQTYTADTMTIDCREAPFMIGAGTIWEGKNLYELYQEAYTPWEWHEAIFAEAAKCGLDCFSTPFDASAVDFLEGFDMPVYKIASFELIDHLLLAKVAATGRPVIMSTGMGALSEIYEAVEVLKNNGCEDLALLKCTSAYPAPAEEANLRRIRHMSEAFGVPVGLSDHTMGGAVPVAAVALGACIVEKHFTRTREEPGPDSSFSMEPAEFQEMVNLVRLAEKAVGEISYQLTEKELASRVFRRSLFVVEDVKKGEQFTSKNVRAIRPGDGLAPKYYDVVLGKTAAQDVCKGTPFSFSLVT